jgi:hypothetical protein
LTQARNFIFGFSSLPNIEIISNTQQRNNAQKNEAHFSGIFAFENNPTFLLITDALNSS